MVDFLVHHPSCRLLKALHLSFANDSNQRISMDHFKQVIFKLTLLIEIHLPIKFPNTAMLLVCSLLKTVPAGCRLDKSVNWQSLVSV